MRPENRFRLAVAPLLVYVLLFPVLSIDTVSRLISRVATQDVGNLVLLVYYELSRAFRTTFGAILILLLLTRAAHRREARVLVLFLLFGVLAYSMAFTGGGYVGPLQEWLSRTLLDAGLTRTHLLFLFGSPYWPLWLALPGLVGFATLFPTPLTAETVQAATSARPGLLRGLPGAGLDVGALMRRFLAAALRRDWLGPHNLWTIGITGAAASLTLRNSPLRWTLLPLLLFALAVAITALHVGYVTGAADTRRRLRWLGRAGLLALLLFAAGGLAFAGKTESAALAGFVLITLAPGVLMVGIGVAVIHETAGNCR